MMRPAGLDWARDGATWPGAAASRFVRAAALRWHVQRFGLQDGAGRGAAPRILLLHGVGSAACTWRDVAPRLAAWADVTAIDLPGHGFTERPVASRMSLPGMAASTAALLAEIDAAPDLVVGHSAGAAIAARMALDGQISPRGVVAINGAFEPFPGVAGAVFPGLAKLMALNPITPRLFAWSAQTPGGVERLIRETGSTLDPAGLALYRRLFASPGHVAGALGMMAGWTLEPLLRDLPRLAAPLLLVAAEADRAVPPGTAARIAALVPNGRLLAIPGGHLAHEEAPDTTAAVIAEEATRLGLRPSETRPAPAE